MVDARKLDMYSAKAGLNDYQVAVAIGMTPTTYSRKKRGNREFKASEISKLIKLLKIPHREIVTTFLS